MGLKPCLEIDVKDIIKRALINHGYSVEQSGNKWRIREKGGILWGTITVEEESIIAGEGLLEAVKKLFEYRNPPYQKKKWF